MLHPLMRDRARRAPGEFRARELGRGARRRRGGLRGAIDEHGGESILPYSYMGTQGLHPGRHR